MKRSTATGKNRKFVIIIFTCACRVLSKMLSNSRKGSFRFKASDWLARASQYASVLRKNFFCATAIVGTWVVLLKGYNRGLSSTCPKPFSRSIFLRTEAHWPALASQSEALNLKLPFLLLDNIFDKTLHAHVNIMITNFLFLPVAVLLFIFPPLKPRTSKHPNQIYGNKKNSFMV